MKTLSELIIEADKLSDEDRDGLTTYLLSKRKGGPLGPDDGEIARRDAEIDDGTAKLITHDELCRAIGR